MEKSNEGWDSRQDILGQSWFKEHLNLRFEKTLIAFTIGIENWEQEGVTKRH